MNRGAVGHLGRTRNTRAGRGRGKDFYKTDHGRVCEVAGGGKPLQSITGWGGWMCETRRERREGQLSLDEPGGARTRMRT